MSTMPFPAGQNPYQYRTPPFVPEGPPVNPGSTIGTILKQAGSGLKKPGGLLNMGKGLGGALGTAASIGTGGLTAGFGIADLLKSRSTVGDLLGGAKTGAGIGTMFAPGLGTLVGAGLGALGGGIRSLFRLGKPSQDELAGRSARESTIRGITQGASQNQLQEAQQAMASKAWKNTQDPLTLIVMRDHLIRSGMDPTQADQTAQGYMKNLWGATKGGTSAVAQATPKPRF